jgi:isocitrate lyase
MSRYVCLSVCVYGWLVVEEEKEGKQKAPPYQHTQTHYTSTYTHTLYAQDVVSLRPSLLVEPASNKQAQKLWSLVTALAAEGKCSHTFGALDPVQVTQMAPHVSTIYVSGWQCSSTASTSNEPGPDFADYPMDTVPNKVHQLFSAQLFHDRRQKEERSRMTDAQKAAQPPVDYLRPIIADGDTGHG